MALPPEVLDAFQAHQLFDALARRPPEHALLHESATEGAEMCSRKRLALRIRLLRKALGEVDARHLATLGISQKKSEPTPWLIAARYAERQKVHEPHQGEDDARHAGFGFAPAGVL